MKKILAFAGSNSSTSINQKLLEHVTGRIQGHDLNVLMLTDFPLPIYSMDIETNDGIPENVKAIANKIAEADGLVIAVNEHNGTVSAFFKNVLDWLSRNERNFLANKKILLISTSPGQRGAKGALEYSKGILARFGGDVIESFSFPSFKDNFADNKVTNEVLDMGIADVLTTFAHQIEE
jgi:chromate reductase, NAD(P)H dehydrogenase (quinone)